MNKKLIILAMAAGALLGARGERLAWYRSASSAMAAGKASGKLVLMICGRETCGNTIGTRDYTCEDPEVRAALDGYETWFCNCDTQQDDFWNYASDKGSFALPLVCVINPSVPNKYVGRSFGYMDTSRMLSFLKANGPKKVKFDANGGEVGEQERTVLPLSAIGKLPTPKRGKYTFLGWYTKKTGGSKISASTKVKSNATYYAYWAAPWTVTFDVNGGALGEGEANKVQVARSKAVGTLPSPTKTGYKLKGWYTKKSGGTKITVKTKVTKNITWYAQWTPRSYPVAVEKIGKGSVSGTGSKAYKSTVTLKATAASGYVFQGWYLDDVLKSKKASYAFKVPLNGVTYTAKFITKAEDRAGIAVKFEGVGVGGDFEATSLPAVTNVCGVLTTWPVAASGLTAVSVSVSGQPKGMKYDAKKKAVTGVATVANKSGTMKITVKSAGASRTWSVKWRTVALPAWATGTFKGKLGEGDAAKGTVTLTVGKTGKVSGKFVNLKKTAYPFSIGSFKSFEGGVLSTKATMKYGTKSVAVEIAVGQDSETSAGFAEVGSATAPFSGNVAVLKK